MSQLASYINFAQDEKVQQVAVTQSQAICEVRQNLLQLALASISMNPSLTHTIGYRKGSIANVRGSILEASNLLLIQMIGNSQFFFQFCQKLSFLRSPKGIRKELKTPNEF